MKKDIEKDKGNEGNNVKNIDFEWWTTIRNEDNMEKDNNEGETTTLDEDNVKKNITLGKWSLHWIKTLMRKIIDVVEEGLDCNLNIEEIWNSNHDIDVRLDYNRWINDVSEVSSLKVNFLRFWGWYGLADNFVNETLM